MKFRCNSCGEIFYRDFAHLKRGRFKCEKCANKNNTPKNKFSIKDVQEYLLKNDINHECQLISTNYVNSITKLDFICNICGEPFQRDFNHIKRNRFRCEKCGEIAGARKNIYTKEYVQQEISKKGYIMTGEYKNAETPFSAKCSRGHDITLRFTYFLQGHSGCRRCATTGNNSWNWKGGESEVIEVLRKSIKQWKKDILARDNYKCVLSDEKKDIVIHHIISFNTLVSQASEESGIPILRKIADYENAEDFLILKEKLISLHKIENGITISRELHNKFHEIYGKGNNTIEQFNEFYNNYS